MPETGPRDFEIGRRLADYPPEFLYHLALISRDELDRITKREYRSPARDRYRRACLPV